MDISKIKILWANPTYDEYEDPEIQCSSFQELPESEKVMLFYRLCEEFLYDHCKQNENILSYLRSTWNLADINNIKEEKGLGFIEGEYLFYKNSGFGLRNFDPSKKLSEYELKDLSKQKHLYAPVSFPDSVKKQINEYNKKQEKKKKLAEERKKKKEIEKAKKLLEKEGISN